MLNRFTFILYLRSYMINNSYAKLHFTVILITAIVLSQSSLAQTVRFTNVSVEAGLDYTHGFTASMPPMQFVIGGGSATGDIDNDGYLDLFFTLGDEQSGAMLHNNGDGTFTELDGFTGDNSFPFYGSGPLFFDYNQDQYIDLIIGSHFRKPPVIFVNNGDLTFSKIERPEFESLNFENTFTITSMDYNMDGYQDLFMSHWLEDFEENHFWKNNGDGSFSNVDSLLEFYNPFNDFENFHATNFTDINGDRWPDLLAASDFETSQIWINSDGKKFELDTINILNDENGMGSTVADFDNDGDMDWYMTNIYDDDGIVEGNWGTTGNKLYVNDGNGVFTEEAELRGVQNTDWGWGTSFSDFDNDGFLDLIATNGWPYNNEQFLNDNTKVFLSQEGEYFIDITQSTGLLDSLQGRGLSAFDYDLDGDLDVFITNINGAVSLWRNDLDNGNHYLTVTLTEPTINRMALGARVQVHSNGITQTREIRCGSNYTSQDPMNAHFGLGDNEVLDSMVITWQDGSIQSYYNVETNQNMNITKLLVSTNNSYNKPISANVYPNPSPNDIRIEFENIETASNLRCEIFNSQGHLIDLLTEYTIVDKYLSFTYTPNQNHVPGIYFVHITNSSNKILSVSFVIE